MFDKAFTSLQDIYRITGRRMGWFLVHAARGTLTRTRAVPASAPARWNLTYEDDFPRGAKLYKLAKQHAWDPDRDIDWSARAPEGEPLIRDDHWLVHSMGLAELLGEEERVRFNRETLAWTLSQILHGEQASLMICSQLVDMREDLDGKLFLASQVMDEARHIEVFRRYLAGLARIAPMDTNIKLIGDSLLAQRDWRKKAIGMLILIEGYALGAFSHHRSGTTDPLLRQILTYVAQDEGRHVGFGVDSIAEDAARCTSSERAELEDYTFSLCRTMFYSRERGGFRTLMDMYWNADKGRMGVSREEFDQRMLAAPVMQNIQREVFEENIFPRLRQLELLSPRITKKYREAELPV